MPRSIGVPAAFGRLPCAPSSPYSFIIFHPSASLRPVVSVIPVTCGSAELPSSVIAWRIVQIRLTYTALRALVIHPTGYYVVMLRFEHSLVRWYGILHEKHALFPCMSLRNAYFLKRIWVVDVPISLCCCAVSGNVEFRCCLRNILTCLAFTKSGMWLSPRGSAPHYFVQKEGKQ